MADSDYKLGREILADATKLADQALAKARKEAEALLAAVRSRQQTLRAERLAAAESASADRIRTLQAVHEVDKRRRSALSRESVVQAILEEAARQVLARDGIDRRRSLLGLLAEAAAAVGSPRLTIRMAPADIALAGETALLETARRAAGSGPDDPVEFAGDPALEGGVVVETADGRRRFDNSPAGRGRRLAKQLRPRLARDLGI